MSFDFLVANGLRMAGALQWGYLAFWIVRRPRKGPQSKVLASFAGCVTGYLLTALSLVTPFPSWIQHFFFVLMFACPYLLWLTAKFLFEDNPRIRPSHVCLGVFMVALDLFTYKYSVLYRYFESLIIPVPFFGPLTEVLLPQANTLILVVLALVSLKKSGEVDLNEARIDFRRTFIYWAASAGALIALSDCFMKVSGIIFQPLNILSALLVYILGCATNSELARSDSWLFSVVTQPLPIPEQQKKPDTFDSEAKEKFRRAIEVEKMYLRPAASIETLAKELSIPEYRIRRYINQELGFQNFNQFLNSFRVSEAKIRLEKDVEKQLPIYNLSVDLGYGSPVSFNRAFKDATGKTPTQYREELQSRRDNKTP